ncbi:MAG: bifunctional indole-3-glycerol-phosphate synthase TrpC/phosphoribosylanthranilate isomerase TrpF [Candidatus Marinimicrobia bacterium]|nr:bifunctional indole-3-glycerol-phosphate synthase TrpC/phosphoribosylanthranilate isomerase TrpF [Candidatus Neomarinimicrobiota bacterium]
MIIDEIIQNKRKEVDQRKSFVSIEKIKAGLSPSVRDFKMAISKGHGLNLIAEVKRKSPSKGTIRNDVNIFEIVKIYSQNHFVSAISFLTDYQYFGGTLEEMLQISLQTTKPVLCKDFIIDEYQIYEARYFGADAILLIASELTTETMEHFINIAKSLKMDCLVEVHNEDEIVKLPSIVDIAGINNRNLKDFTISLDTTKKLSEKLRKKSNIIVTESGINTRNDVKKIIDFADAILVGTSLMLNENPSARIASLFKPDIKICGITQLKDAIYCGENGVDYLGFIFSQKSKRYTDPRVSAAISTEIKDLFPQVKLVGVFVNEDPKRVLDIMNRCQLDLAQLHGDETESFYYNFQDRVIKVFRIENQLDQIKINQINNCQAKYVLMDTYSPNVYGGTGQSFNWKNIEKIKHRNLFVAGGINSENYTDILGYKPDVLDISSGVENSPGIKDYKKIDQILKGLK